MDARRLLPTSLTGRLVATAVGLVALVSLLVAAATTAALRSSLYSQVDEQVRALALELPQTGSGHAGPPGPDRDGDGYDPRHGSPLPLHIVVPEDGSQPYAEEYQGQQQPLSEDQRATVEAIPTDQRMHTLVIGDDTYRVLAGTGPEGTVISGLPTGSIGRTVGPLVWSELAFLVLGVGLAGLAALLLVRRQLTPLRDVARTAHEVAELPLATGAIGVTARVPERLTDERTEVGRVGSALNTLLGHVEGALDARHRSEQQVRRFVADASHELRTPLATIQGYAELTRRAPESQHLQPEHLQQAMTKVEAEAHRMSALVEDLLLLARLDAGRPLERREVDLTRMAVETVSDAQVLAPEHRWLLDLPDDPVLITGDEQRLHQVLTNLLTNARRHTPPGTTVTIGVERGDLGGAVLTVGDDGPGIPDELQGRVFERFTRADTARTRASGGAGLGLSLVAAIVAAHGGTIEVTSRPGGTVFRVVLP